MRKIIIIIIIPLLTLISINGAGAIDAELKKNSRVFTAYAPPSMWGPWVNIASHGGKVTYTITAKARGNTNIVGKVQYHGSGGLKVRTFYDSITITTSDSWSNVLVQFKGEPLGTAVRGTISP